MSIAKANCSYKLIDSCELLHFFHGRDRVGLRKALPEQGTPWIHCLGKACCTLLCLHKALAACLEKAS